MIAKLDDYLRFNETALNLRAQRQQLLASNIANADTPNYKARDIDFNSALQQALTRDDKTQTAAQLKQTSSAHMVGTDTNTLDGAPLLYRTEVQGNIDGNTVDMDVERNQFADNSIRYEAGLTFITGQIKDMLAALQG